MIAFAEKPRGRLAMTDVSRPWPGFPVSSSALTTALLAVVLVASLYLAREVLVPISLALLLSLVLAPLVRLLRNIRIPRPLAVIVAVLLAFAVIFSLGALMVSQVNQLAGDLPRYQTTLREKIQSLRGAATSTGTLERASEVLQDLGRELDKPNRSTSFPAPVTPDSSKRPIPVEVKQPDPGALQTLVALISPLIHPLTTTGIVIIFVIFILMQREDLRNRLIRLAGARDLQRTTAALDDAGQRLSRLFLMQLLLNGSFGVVIGVGLWLIGVPSAPLWGMLVMILRFVPYIGAVISAIFPLILAAAVGPDWSMVLWTAGLFLVVEPIAGHVVEPMLYGHSTGLSPVAVIASATFWTWLWGPIGLVLATPLTMSLVVLGRHVDRLKFLDVIFGDQPALKPEELVYQRLLAGDPVEAAEQAQEFLKEKPLLSYYQDVLIEGLKLAQEDAEKGLLDEERSVHIRDTVAEIVDDLDTWEDKPVAAAAEASADGKPKSIPALASSEPIEDPMQVPAEWRDRERVLCIPGVGPLDEAIALILAQLVTKRGIGARAERSDALSMSRLFTLETEDVAIVCICYIETATSAQIRYAARRLRRKAPQAIIITLLIDNEDKAEPSTSPGDGSVRRSLEAAINQITGIAQAAAQRRVDAA
jgi:predicted PurR-regulated permease PerM